MFHIALRSHPVYLMPRCLAKEGRVRKRNDVHAAGLREVMRAVPQLFLSAGNSATAAPLLQLELMLESPRQSDRNTELKPRVDRAL